MTVYVNADACESHINARVCLQVPKGDEHDWECEVETVFVGDGDSAFAECNGTGEYTFEICDSSGEGCTSQAKSIFDSFSEAAGSDDNDESLRQAAIKIAKAESAYIDDAVRTFLKDRSIPHKIPNGYLVLRSPVVSGHLTALIRVHCGGEETKVQGKKIKCRALRDHVAKTCRDAREKDTVGAAKRAKDLQEGDYRSIRGITTVLKNKITQGRRNKSERQACRLRVIKKRIAALGVRG